MERETQKAITEIKAGIKTEMQKYIEMCIIKFGAAKCKAYMKTKRNTTQTEKGTQKEIYKRN